MRASACSALARSGVGVAHRDVREDRAREEEDVLRHDREVLAQRVPVVAADVLAEHAHDARPASS